MSLYQNVILSVQFFKWLRIYLEKKLAIVGMKSLVSALVRRFDVQVVEPNQELQLAPYLNAMFRGGLLDAG